MDRRQFVKTVGVGAGAVAAGGALPGQMGPVQRGRGIGIVGGSLLLAAGLAAGALVERHFFSNGDLEDAQNLGTQNELHSWADGYLAGETDSREDLRQQFIDRPQTNTPYGTAAFDEFEAAGAKKLGQGESLSAAIEAAQEALREHLTIARYNRLQAWNRLVVGPEDSTGLDDKVANDVSAGTNVFEVEGDNTGGIQAFEPSQFNNASAVDTGETYSSWPPEEDEDGNREPPDSGKYVSFKAEWSGAPKPLSDIDAEGLPNEPVDIYYLAVDGPTSPGLLGPGGSVHEDLPLNPEGPTKFLGTIKATHPDRSDRLLADMDLHRQVLEIQTEVFEQYRDNEVGDWMEYLDNLLAEGEITIEDILGPRQLVEQFSDASSRSQLAAQAAAMGIPTPGEYGVQMRISHPDIASDSLWADIYIDWVDAEGLPREVTADDVIESSEYNSAYAGFYREDNGEYDVRILSGDEGITVHELSEGESLDFEDQGGYVDPGGEPSPDEVDDRLATTAELEGLIEDALNENQGPSFPGLGDIGEGAWNILILIGVGVLAVWGLGQLGNS